MSESTRTSRAPAEKRLTYQQWKRRKMLRLARNWVLFLAGCAAVIGLGIRNGNRNVANILSAAEQA